MQHKTLFYSLILNLSVLCVIVSSNAKTPVNISIEYDKSQTRIRTQIIEILDSSHLIDAQLDINSITTWIKQTSISLDMKNFNKLGSSSGLFGKTSFHGFSVKTTINISNNRLNRFPISIVNMILGIPPFSSDAILGLGRTSDLMNYIHDELLLDKVFTLSINNSSKGNLSIGSTPEVFKTNSPLISYCKQDLFFNNEWSCILQYVVIGEAGRLTLSDKNPSQRKFEILTKYSSVYYNDIDNSKMIFDTIVKYILCPVKFILFLDNYYFKKELENLTCIYKRSYYVCSFAAIPYLSSLKFIIDNHEYILNTNDLFLENGDMKEFLIRPNENSNDWVLGNYFLKKYTMVFDYDNNMINFHSDNIKNRVVINEGDYEDTVNTETSNATNNNLLILLLNITITLGCFSIVLLLLFKYYQTKLFILFL